MQKNNELAPWQKADLPGAADAARPVVDRRLRPRRHRARHLDRQRRVPARPGRPSSSTGCRCCGSRWSRCSSRPSSTPSSCATRVATGEPVVTGFMRTRPRARPSGPGLRGAVLPADRLAGVGGHRGRRDLLPVRGRARRRRRPMRRLSTGSASRRSSPASRCCWSGRRIERTLELLNWVLVALHPRRLPACSASLSCPRPTGRRGAGFVGLRHGAAAPSTSCRTASTCFLLGALVGYSGARRRAAT